MNHWLTTHAKPCLHFSSDSPLCQMTFTAPPAARRCSILAVCLSLCQADCLYSLSSSHTFPCFQSPVVSFFLPPGLVPHMPSVRPRVHDSAPLWLSADGEGCERHSYTHPCASVWTLFCLVHSAVFASAGGFFLPSLSALHLKLYTVFGLVQIVLHGLDRALGGPELQLEGLDHVLRGTHFLLELDNANPLI